MTWFAGGVLFTVRPKSKSWIVQSNVAVREEGDARGEAATLAAFEICAVSVI